MSLLGKLASIAEQCRGEYENRERNRYEFEPIEQVQTAISGEGKSENTVAWGDNQAFMEYLLDQKQMGGKIKLIYVDPPFFSGADYGIEIRLKSEKLVLPLMKQKAYHDTWEHGMEEYLKMLTSRLFLMRELLSEDGGIWIHLDWHAVHYVKLMMDEIFGEKQFINEVIWNYKSGGVSKKHFARKHDTLLYYGKTGKRNFYPVKEKSYNRGMKPYRFKGVKEYRDEIGWYTLVNKKDVWQIDMVGRTAGERTGYATQKPELLLSQILESCTKEGDLCADFFGGSGTLAAVAAKGKRPFITCDMGSLAVLNMQKRLAREQIEYCLYQEVGTDAKKQKNCPEVLGKNLGKLHTKLTLQKGTSLDKAVLHIELMKYEPSCMDCLPVEEKHQKTLKKVIKEDSLQLLEYWSIDPDYDGVLFCPRLALEKDKTGLPLEAELFCRVGRWIAIRCIDVFGCSVFIEIPRGDVHELD